eukprot:COSAG05_NODE_874_length_6832_cov_2.914303_4_plen_73_part_00
MNPLGTGTSTQGRFDRRIGRLQAARYSQIAESSLLLLNVGLYDYSCCMTTTYIQVHADMASFAVAWQRFDHL